MNHNKGKYIISYKTYMLQPQRDGFQFDTKVIERDNTFIVPSKPLAIVSRSCEFYGSSYQILQNSSKLFLGNVHKVPILIAHAHSVGTPVIFLPTLSPHSEQNVWISYQAISNIVADDLGCTVHLENGVKVKLNVSATTLYRQYTFAGLLERDFFKKQKDLNRSAHLFPEYNPFTFLPSQNRH
ncbi:competence protein ComK [Sporosarcina contaminans]|uniref:Competence protein ComK n=1 Tax=Sporosarcina contaminans TaxID=633403 RepID=A0ABW3TVP7_9BACL